MSDHYIQPRQFHCPDVATKRLAIKHLKDGRRKLPIGSNLLRLFGFEPGTLTLEQPVEGGGFKIVVVAPDMFTAAAGRPKLVYERQYKGRKNNPLEALIEVTCKDLLKEFSAPDTKAHVTFRHGEITVRPITSRAASRIERFIAANRPFTALAGCTSGVDVKAMQNGGFTIDGIIEWRPQEKRDSRDLTETGVVNTLRNTPVSVVVNEDIMELDLSRLLDDVLCSHPTLLSFAPVCSDWSVNKRRAVKERAFEEGTSTLDMAYDVLRIVDALNPANVVIEQVPGFYSSDMYKVFSLRMRRWVYTEYSGLYDAKEFGGYTGRKRYYGFFTSLPGSFSFGPTHQSANDLWAVVEKHLPDCRDVTHSKAVQDGAAMGLLRVLDMDSKACPTITRSQSRMAKDTIAIRHEGKFLHPSEGLLAELQGLPEGLVLDAVSKEQAVEIIGQGVDGALHDALIEAIHAHIEESLQILDLKAA